MLCYGKETAEEIVIVIFGQNINGPIEVLCFYKFNEGCEHEIRYGSSSLFTIKMREQKVNIIINFRINN